MKKFPERHVPSLPRPLGLVHQQRKSPREDHPAPTTTLATAVVQAAIEESRTAHAAREPMRTPSAAKSIGTVPRARGRETIHRPRARRGRERPRWCTPHRLATRSTAASTRTTAPTTRNPQSQGPSPSIAIQGYRCHRPQTPRRKEPGQRPRRARRREEAGPERYQPSFGCRDDWDASDTRPTDRGEGSRHPSNQMMIRRSSILQRSPPPPPAPRRGHEAGSAPTLGSEAVLDHAPHLVAGTSVDPVPRTTSNRLAILCSRAPRRPRRNPPDPPPGRCRASRRTPPGPSRC